MLKTYVTSARIAEFEPRITDYYATGQTSYTTLVAKAKEVLTQDLRSNRLELKKLCIPLTLQASTSETTSKTGSKSDEDVIERRIWVVETTAVGDTETFTLQGTNDTSSETYTTITTQEFTTATESTTLFDDTYKFYRVNYSGTSATYSSKLIEESFHLAHIYKSLELVFKQMMMRDTDNWGIKMEHYRELYETMMKNIIYSYDANLSGAISQGEDQQMIRATFTR